DGVPADMRLFGAACSSFRSGDRESAGVSLEAALAVCRSPRLHAQLVELQGRMLWRADEAEAALDLLLAEARRVASSVPDQAVALLVAAFDAAMTQGDVGRGVEVAAEVAALRGDTALPWALCLAGR